MPHLRHPAMGPCSPAFWRLNWVPAATPAPTCLPPSPANPSLLCCAPLPLPPAVLTTTMVFAGLAAGAMHPGAIMDWVHHPVAFEQIFTAGTFPWQQASAARVTRLPGLWGTCSLGACSQLVLLATAWPLLDPV